MTEAATTPPSLDSADPSSVPDSSESHLDSSDAPTPAVYWYRGPLRRLYVVGCGVLGFLNLLALIVEVSVLKERPTCLAMVIISLILYCVLSLYLTVYLPYYASAIDAIANRQAPSDQSATQREGQRWHQLGFSVLTALLCIVLLCVSIFAVVVLIVGPSRRHDERVHRIAAHPPSTQPPHRQTGSH
jgi:ABC-type Fe3+ transport system permease subunit